MNKIIIGSKNNKCRLHDRRQINVKVSLFETLPYDHVYFLENYRLARWRYKENDIDIKIKSELGRKNMVSVGMGKVLVRSHRCPKHWSER